MRRVAVTGMGIVSPLGNDVESVAAALREGRSGLQAVPESARHGLRSQVAGVPRIDLDGTIDRKPRRFMGDAAGYAWVSMREAIADAGLSQEQLRDPRTGVIAGSGGGSPQWQIEAGDLLRDKGVRRVGPYMVPRTMCSTVSASLATTFGIRGTSYSISAACATSAHCIGAAADLIRGGAQDIVFAGGGEELHWGMTCQFDAMGALSTRFNHVPERASRPYDADRDGFVIAAGGGILVLEDLDHARARGARIHAELVGLRRDFRRRRHGRPQRCGCGALHGHGAGRNGHPRYQPRRLSQHPRHRHAGGGYRRTAGGARRVRR
jgi:3-oxoacyl-[acyl-carrier-protein] synthase-1